MPTELALGELDVAFACLQAPTWARLRTALQLGVLDDREHLALLFSMIADIVIDLRDIAKKYLA